MHDHRYTPPVRRTDLERRLEALSEPGEVAFWRDSAVLRNNQLDPGALAREFARRCSDDSIIDNVIAATTPLTNRGSYTEFAAKLEREPTRTLVERSLMRVIEAEGDNHLRAKVLTALSQRLPSDVRYHLECHFDGVMEIRSVIAKHLCTDGAGSLAAIESLGDFSPSVAPNGGIRLAMSPTSIEAITGAGAIPLWQGAVSADARARIERDLNLSRVAADAAGGAIAGREAVFNVLKKSVCHGSEGCAGGREDPAHGDLLAARRALWRLFAVQGSGAAVTALDAVPVKSSLAELDSLSTPGGSPRSSTHHLLRSLDSIVISARHLTSHEIPPTWTLTAITRLEKIAESSSSISAALLADEIANPADRAAATKHLIRTMGMINDFCSVFPTSLQTVASLVGGRSPADHENPLTQYHLKALYVGILEAQRSLPGCLDELRDEIKKMIQRGDGSS